METELEKMIAGSPYDPKDSELTAMRLRSRVLCRQFNQALPNEKKLRTQVLKELLGEMGTGVWIEPPFQVDYGSNLFLGDNVYMNFNCVILDDAPIHIGRGTMLATGVQLLTAEHPIEAAPRRAGVEYASAITIGEDVWIGGGVIVCPGVTIGDRTVIGAGSVVTKNIPSDVVAVGNPCRILRVIDNPEQTAQ